MTHVYLPLFPPWPRLTQFFHSFLSFLDGASAVYEPIHRELAQKSRQALISAYFSKVRRQQEVASGEVQGDNVEVEALEQADLEAMSDDDELASIVSDNDFAGF